MRDTRSARTTLGSVLVVGGLMVAVALLGLRVAPTKVWAHEVPNPCDFTTGGGFVFKDPRPLGLGPMVNFGIVGGCRKDKFFGHVNVVDHTMAPGLHINGPVTAYFDPLIGGGEYRDLCGTDTKTGLKFRVRTLDKGEPGGLDRFGVKREDGYVVSTRELGPGENTETGGGGNIKLHKPTKGPRPTADESVACPSDADLGS